MAEGAVELAEAYVPVIPSFSGIEGKIAQGFGAPLIDSAKDSGKDAGKGFSDNFESIAGAAMLGAGLIIGGSLLDGMNAAIEKESGKNKLTAQLALSAQESESFGKVAGELYSGAYGESMGDVNDAIKSVVQNVGGMRSASEEELQGITGKVMSVADTFDQDLGSVTTAVGQLMKNGMAKDAEGALDIIAKGLQTNGGSADDLLDSFTEYSPLFSRLGLDGAAGLGMINQGMAAGARNTDIVSDALKEFQIRATDGSESSAEAFEAIGLNAEQMTSKIAGGGAGAKEGLDQVLDGLRGIEDPVARNAAAVGLFGTQAEDLGDALFSLDPSSAVQGLGEVAGAAAKVDETVGSGAGPTLTSFQREMESGFGAMATSVLPVLMPIVSALSQFAPILGPLALGLMAVTAAQWLWNAAQLANPLTWIVIGVGLVIAAIILLVTHWDEAVAFLLTIWSPIAGFFSNMWSQITLGAQIAWDGILALLSGAWDAIVWVFSNLTLVGFIITHWDQIMAFLGGAGAALSGFFSNMWGQITLGAQIAWDGFTALLRGVWDGIVWMFMNLTLVGIIISHWDQIVAFTTTTFNNIVTFLGGVWDTAITALSAGVENVTGFFSDTWDRIAGFFTGAWDKARTWGQDIVGGMMDGLKGMGDDVKNFFGDIMPDWVDKSFTGAMEIHSPSRLFARHGEDTVEGFVVGTEAKKNLIRDSMETLVPAPKLPESSMEPASIGLRNASAPVSKTINNTFELPDVDADALATLIITKQERSERH
jgi:hypothetical protein